MSGTAGPIFPVWPTAASFLATAVETHQGEPITLLMLWFSNAGAQSSSQFIGLDCGRHEGAYVLTLVHPGGSETRTIFDDEDTMIGEAVGLHIELMRRGWRALPRTACC